MTTDTTLLAALETAANNDPSNAALRLHLAELLLAAGEPQRALDHCTTVLNAEPDHPLARTLAAKASQSLDDNVRASQPRDVSPTIVPLSIIDGDMPDDEIESDVERPRITLADVGGMEDVKNRLNISFLGPMKNPQLRQMYGKSLRGGLLLFGPPGCGKTFIARATAGELGARFICVGLADILDMYIGQSERNLHQIFETARRSAPCVLFLDEVDALGQKRSQLRNYAAHRQVVAQLLTELDSVLQNNEGVFVLAATNHPWDIDSALKRPGRFDRSVLVLPPDPPAREAILSYHLAHRPVEHVDIPALARRTEGYSGADLAYICEAAAEFAMADSLATGDVRPIAMVDLVRACKEIKPSTSAWFQTAHNYAAFANEGGVYDDLLAYIRLHRLI